MKVLRFLGGEYKHFSSAGCSSCGGSGGNNTSKLTRTTLDQLVYEVNGTQVIRQFSAGVDKAYEDDEADVLLKMMIKGIDNRDTPMFKEMKQ